jgi:hypothetical protein
MTSRTIEELTARLASLRGAVRRLYAIDGVSRLLLVAVAAAATTFLIDWSLPDLPSGVRISFLLLSLGALAWAVARFLVYPLRRPIGDDDLAVCVERTYPGLQDRLISALQLARASGRPGWEAFNSPALVDALVADAKEAAAALDFRRVLVPRPVRRIALLAGVVTAAGIGLAAANPAIAGIWFNRLLGGDAKWPRQTDLEVVDPPRFVARGDDFRVVVRARRKIPTRVTLHYAFEGGDRGSARMTALPIVRGPEGEHGEFTHEFPRVVENFRFSARGGDDETKEYAVEVRTAPALERLEAWYDFPDYLGLEDTPEDRPEAGGNVKAPAGTAVRLRGTCNEPLASAQIVFGSRPDKPEPLAVADAPAAAGAPAGGDGRRRVLNGRFLVRTGDEYRLELLAENQLRNREPIRYTITAIPDGSPVLRAIEPGADRVATLQAVWPLQVAATDDYGLQSVRLVWWVVAQSPGPEHTESFAYPAQNDAGYGARKIGSRFPFDLSRTGAKEREQVAYRFEAADFDPAKAKPAQTRTFHFTIWSRSDLEKRVGDDMNRLREALREIRRNEEKIQASVTGLRDRLQPLDALESGSKREIAAAALDQRQKVGQRLEGAVRDLQEIVKTVRYNRLLDQTALEKQERLQALLDETAHQKSPAAGHAVTETAGARGAGDRRERFDRALGLIDDILSDLDAALVLLDDWMDYQGVVRLWRDVKEKQEQVNKVILDLLQKK